MFNCCFDQECSYPVCQKGRPSEMPTRYKGGPAITHLSFPVVDVDRPWGNTTCSYCNGFCAGHYLVKMVDTTYQWALKLSAPPPSLVLKSYFSNYNPTRDLMQEEAKKVVLTPKIWIDHLHTVLLNRKRGAAKAEAIWHAKKSLKVPVTSRDRKSRNLDLL